MMTRAVPEWIGKTDDTPAPPRVRLRVFDRYSGICYLTGRKIRAGEAWDVEHVIAIINGGQNREGNMAPALKAPHRLKTNADLAEKSKVATKRKKHLGIKRQGQPIPGSRRSGLKKHMDGRVTRR